MSANVVKLRIGNNGGGEPRKSVAQHKLEGTYRKHRHGKERTRPPTKATKLPPPPDYFTDLQRQIWRKLAAKLDPLAICAATDVESFTLMVQAYSICLQAHRALGDGLTYAVQTKRGRAKRARPEVGVLAQFQKITLYHFSRFGMTPADRDRVVPGNDGVLQNDPLHEFTHPPE